MGDDFATTFADVAALAALNAVWLTLVTSSGPSHACWIAGTL
jgi:hypothetical protein